jgi:2-(1,2-epoxy-1,2-dihydrophenyl)acetyl-CoA isomerase
MTEPSAAPVLLDVRAGVARLTLNRPDVANAIDLDLARALAAATRRVRADPAVRVVLLTGAGSRFCAGGDVRGFAGVGDRLGDHLGELLGALHPAIADLGALEVPVVAAVQGSAAGAGISLLAAADLVVAAERTRFVLAYTSLGLVPDGGSTWSLPRAVGLRRALELALTNRPLDASEALAWGLVTRVVPDDELSDEAERLVTELAAGPPAALAAAKRLLKSGLGSSLDEQLTREAAAMVVAGNSVDGQEGVAAFVEKRRARFSPPT